MGTMPNSLMNNAKQATDVLERHFSEIPHSTQAAVGLATCHDCQKHMASLKGGHSL
jgi:hypothetical protein